MSMPFSPVHVKTPCLPILVHHGKPEPRPYLLVLNTEILVRCRRLDAQLVRQPDGEVMRRPALHGPLGILLKACEEQQCLNCEW